MRVLTLSTLFPDASRPNFGVFVERQTRGLAAVPGVEVTVVAPVGLPPWPLSRSGHYRSLAQLPQRETWHGLDVHRPRFTTIPGTQGRWHAAALERALVPVLDRLQFDVIDASFFFPDGPAAVALGRRYGVPVSIKARGADIHYWGRSTATAKQVLAAGRDADGLLAVSAAIRDDMIALGMPAERIAVHRTGIDRDRFHPRGRVPGRRVVAVGALIPRKGHDVVIRAVASLPGVTLDIAGEGPERERLAALIASLGVGDRVRLLGAVPHDDLPARIAAADVMALASASEGLANAWVEALACGTPVVVTPAGGAAEVVTAAAGRLAERTPEAFAEAIGALLADPLPVEGVTASVAAFGWDTNAAQLAAHLRRLVAEGRRRG
ncbi:glycosyltransferase [Microvirga sp. SRT01]|uniref:Glycosyltransferase n=1 Tax=Sphingomonas longa TaxID=2778730 RepID=A0ABS2DAV7_9SPHN|nr:MULTISPECIES: glycosyltransferase [Alphaproteobacteria]MBM6578077.1 glycosyltransferase [Sphingomonas sp. BT552]MBR7711118.1 glycosyltransferase [Microvirga sp. SRT01]